MTSTLTLSWWWCSRCSSCSVGNSRGGGGPGVGDYNIGGGGGGVADNIGDGGSGGNTFVEGTPAMIGSGMVNGSTFTSFASARSSTI